MIVRSTVEVVEHANSHSPCLGSCPFKVNGQTVWQFIYEDGSIDSGVKMIKHTNFYKDGTKTFSFSTLRKAKEERLI